jgi:AraC-like DNA-binding protein
VDVDAVAAAAGLDLASLENVESRIERGVWTATWRALGEAVGDPAIAFHLAGSIPFGAFDVLDYIVVSSATVRDALTRAADYWALIHDHTTVRLIDTPAGLAFEYRLVNDRVGASTYSAETAFVCVLDRLKMATGVAWTPISVRFAHRCVGDPAEYEKKFGCPVVFESDVNEIVLPPGYDATPMLRADPTLNNMLMQHAQSLLSRLPETDSFVEQVRAEIFAAMAGADPTIERVAKRLALSARTLQRRLRENGVTFNALLDSVRSEMARRLLADRAMAIGEVGFLLGFSEVSAFHRAFRRWTGKTPGEFRRDAA